MRAMILAAGLGTRLRPLTDELPKPLVPVGDRPAVAHIAARLAGAGITFAVLNTHHLAEAFTPAVLASLPLSLRVIHEPAILGTGGGVANAASLLGDDDVIVWNGDILADVDLASMVAQHRASGSPATLGIAPRALGEGTIGLGEGGRVVRLRGERFGEEIASGDFLGIYILSPSFRARLPSPGCLIGDGAMPLLREGSRLGTFTIPGPWDDIGSLASYLAANRRWLAGRTSHLGEGAHLDTHVDLRDSILGAGSSVRGTGLLHDVVVWPGAIAEAPLSHAVVTPRGIVHAP
ncbi:Nucleotidyl transferase [Minicystis rosea]|nr:Nucleotidyl transferase [Minicystis rosea]